MSHRFFKSQNNPPKSGWVGTACGVEIKGNTFGSLVRLLKEYAGANNCPKPFEDEVALELCKRNPGYCWGKSDGSAPSAAVSEESSAQVQRVDRPRGCSRCGGGRRR